MKKKSEYIQGIRAIACISIAVVHFFSVLYQPGNLFLMSKTGRIFFSLFFGDLGVAIFSLLAGYFAISYNKRHSDNLGEYLLKRYIKLWSAVLLIAIAWFVLTKIPVLFHKQTPLFQPFPSLKLYIINSIFINNRIQSGLWPLLSIFIGTVIVSITDKYTKSNIPKVFLLVFFALATYILGNNIINIVCLGALYGIFEKNKIIEKIKNSNWKYLAFIIGYAILVIRPGQYKNIYFTLSIGALMLIMVSDNIKPLKWILSRKALVHIGDISFEIYCVHNTILGAMLTLFHLIGYGHINDSARPEMALFLIAYLIIVYFSAIIFKIITSAFSKKVNVYMVKLLNSAKQSVSNIRKTIDEKDKYFFIAIGVLFIILSSYIVNSSQSTNGYFGVFSMDYLYHNKVADVIFEGLNDSIGKFHTGVYTYPLYHALTKVVSVFTGLSIHFSSSIVICFFLFVTIMAVRHFLLYYNKNISKHVINAVSFTSVILMNLYIPTLSQTLLLPMGAPNLWHNPTFLAARPFAMLVTILFIRFYKKKELINRDWIILAVSSLLCFYTKPNFALAFYPVSGLMILYKYIKSPKNNYKYLIFWIYAIIPSLLLNLYQYSYMSLAERTGGSLYRGYLISSYELKELFIVLILPIFMFVTEGYKKYKDELYIFIIFATLLSWVQYKIAAHGDTIWGFEMSLFMLYVYSAKLLFIDTENKKTKIIGTSIWIAQTIIGIFYFATGVLGSNLIY